MLLILQATVPGKASLIRKEEDSAVHTAQFTLNTDLIQLGCSNHSRFPKMGPS